MTSTPDLARPGSWHEPPSACRWAARGCPGVAEFAVHEFAAALGKSPEAGRRFLGQAVEGFYRLPDVES